MMEVLLRNVSLAPENTASVCLLKFVSKLIVYFTINNQEFEELSAQIITSKNISTYRSLGSSNTSYTNYRWCKSILQMFVIESHKLMHKKEMCLELLQVKKFPNRFESTYNNNECFNIGNSSNLYSDCATDTFKHYRNTFNNISGKIHCCANGHC